MDGAAYLKNGFLGKWKIVDFLLGGEAPQTPLYSRLPDLKFVYQISKLGQIRLPDLKIVCGIGFVDEKVFAG